MNKKISVVVPVYNAEHYLKKCINSIINQSYKNLEIVVINDGSTDNSLEILEEYASKDDRITIINQENKGVGAARNTGIDISSGDYISFVDADDELDLNYFCVLLNRAQRYNADIVGSNIGAIFGNEVVYPFEKRISECTLTKDRIIDDYLNFKISPAVWGKMYSRELIGDIRFDEININEDFIFEWEIIKNAKRFIKTNETHYYYYEDRINSLTKKKFSKSNMSIIEHAYKVLTDVHDMRPDLLTDAKNYFYAFSLHNLFLYYKYITETNDNDELYLEEKKSMEHIMQDKNKLDIYFLPFERDLNIQEMLQDINDIINKRMGEYKCL